MQKQVSHLKQKHWSMKIRCQKTNWVKGDYVGVLRNSSLFYITRKSPVQEQGNSVVRCKKQNGEWNILQMPCKDLGTGFSSQAWL